jgi:hypothetical protein
MRVLRLAASDEDHGRMAPGSQAHEVAAALLREATGEEVETTIRNLWPDDGLPDLVDRWMDRYQPDLVLLKVNAFWFNYLSVPLRLERALGPAGKYIGRAGVRAGEIRWVARSPVFRNARRFLLRTIGGATYFTPEQVVTSMRECATRILAHEGGGLVVVGPHSRLNHELTRKAAAAHERRRLYVHNSMKQFCAELHVPFRGQDVLPGREEVAAMVGADQLHLNAEAARRGGEEEAAAFLQVWQKIHGEPAR